jgi:hypothetical protein
MLRTILSIAILIAGMLIEIDTEEIILVGNSEVVNDYLSQ